jgi:hypothetical protein
MMSHATWDTPWVYQNLDNNTLNGAEGKFRR